MLNIKDALSELYRERSVRKRVYPRLVMSGRLTIEGANMQNTRLEAAIQIVETAWKDAKKAEMIAEIHRQNEARPDVPH